jgi:hypothetical protein
VRINTGQPTKESRHWRVAIDSNDNYRIQGGLNGNYTPEIYETRQEAAGAIDGLTVGPQPGFAITDAMRQKVAAGMPLFSKRAQDESTSTSAPKNAAPARKATHPATGKKVAVPVKIEDTGEVATLTMDYSQTADEYVKRLANMDELMRCLQ